jgi:circadian clock protein KaiC
LPAHHFYLIEGNPGTGKTTLALQFLLEGLRHREKPLYVTLSESKRELEAVARSHGWSLDKVPIFELSPSDQDLSPEEQYTVFHPSDVELADTTTALLKHIEAVQPARIVIDSLSELRMLAREPLRYRRQILALKRFFAGRDCTALLLDDRTTQDNDLQLQSIAHGVILMYSMERDFGTQRRKLEVRKLRGSRFREGFHDLAIKTGGLVVYPRLVASEHRPRLRRNAVPSGLAELDKLLGGGVDSGTSTLLVGPAGCGKSTVALRFALSAAERGERAAMFIFDETAETLLRRARSFGIDLESHISGGRIVLQQVDPAELSGGEFTALVRAEVENEARVVLVDSLNGYMNAMPGESFLMLQLHELLTYTNQMGVATLVTMAQHGMLGTTMALSVDVSYLADTVLLFRYFEAAGKVRQALSVVKKRSGAHERTIRELMFTDGKIVIGQPLTEFEGVLTGIPKYRGSAEALGSRAVTARK